MRYAFINAHMGQHAVRTMCRVLAVSRSGYYAWRNRKTTQSEQTNQALLQKIKRIYRESDKSYGSPRIYRQLREEGEKYNRKRIVRLMRKHHIVAKKAPRRYPVTTKQGKGASLAVNLLQQDFTAQRPNQKWVTDITYIDTAEGWLYLSVILDLYSRRVVGWGMSDRMDVHLVSQALKMAFHSRHPQKGLIHHSDRGSQYTSKVYQGYLHKYDCLVSMSFSGNCYDNAVAESFFATLKTECADSQFSSREQARRKIFHYIEAWYNRKRLHSSLGYMSPVMFESRH
jgi:transposase InsO family protein